MGFGFRVDLFPPFFESGAWSVFVEGVCGLFTSLFTSSVLGSASTGAVAFGSESDEFLGGLPLVTISPSGAPSRIWAGLAFDQWCNWTFSTPDLKVPILILIVDLLGLSTILCGPV